LLGEIAVGIIYGSPLAGILEHVWEETFLTLGYLGLLLIVFEGVLSLLTSSLADRRLIRCAACSGAGGLSTPLDTLFASLPLATAVALTGIGAPILLSLALISGGFGYPLLESFAAGAALSSTSLGTTFTVLRSAGGDLALEKTRIGTVLAAGAVFDDGSSCTCPAGLSGC
jgi:Kef-type K+ transport system membrane component KefB